MPNKYYVICEQPSYETSSFGISPTHSVVFLCKTGIPCNIPSIFYTSVSSLVLCVSMYLQILHGMTSLDCFCNSGLVLSKLC